VEDGFPPDSISTDFHMGNVNGPVVGMLNTMSKCMALGMSLEEVIERSTSVPARLIGRPDLGTLAPGSDADVAVFRLQRGRFGFAACGRARHWGAQRLECMLTIRSGRIVYDPTGMSMPEWREAPPAYWELRR
jgi:dihydroorotase